ETVCRLRACFPFRGSLPRFDGGTGLFGPRAPHARARFYGHARARTPGEDHERDDRGSSLHATGNTRRMITVEGLSKSYRGSSFAVRDVSFRVDKGEIVGFLGPNGAGKTTTLRVVAGFLGMTSGKVTLAGHDIVD